MTKFIHARNRNGDGGGEEPQQDNNLFYLAWSHDLFWIIVAGPLCSSCLAFPK